MEKFFSKISKLFLIGIVVSGVLLSFNSAKAGCFNTDSLDKPTLRISNYTKNPNCSNCWASTTTADPGDIISFVIYYHNTCSQTALQTKAKINLPSGNFTFSAISADLWAQDIPAISGNVSLYLTSSSKQTLTFIPGSLKWYPNNQSSVSYPLLYGQNGSEIIASSGINLGNISPGWPSQGYVVFRAQLSNNSSSLPLSSVSLTANPSSGYAPLNYVDLTASVATDGSGDITYYFDCQNDGNWEKIYTSSNTSYTAYDICNYFSSGNYIARVRAERAGSVVENTASIYVYPSYSSVILTVDIKANGLDGSVSIGYNQSVNLSWNSSNANSCIASGDWSGAKPIFGSESTGNLTFSKIYILSCSGSGGFNTDSVTVNVGVQPIQPIQPVQPVQPVQPAQPFFTLSKFVRNVSDGTNFSDSVSADPNEMLSFMIQIKNSNQSLFNLTVRDVLPKEIIYKGNLKIDNALSTSDIVSGIKFNSLSPNQIMTITFDGAIADANQFAFGKNELVNTVIATANSVPANSSLAKIIVFRKAVAGAATSANATSVSTGLTNNLFMDTFLIPLIIALIAIWIFKSRIFQIEEWLDRKKRRYCEYRAKKELQSKIIQIKNLTGLEKKI